LAFESDCTLLSLEREKDDLIQRRAYEAAIILARFQALAKNSGWIGIVAGGIEGTIIPGEDECSG
jgi:hypothetical protein